MARLKVEGTGEWFPIKLFLKFRFLFTEKINPTGNSAYVTVSTMKRLGSNCLNFKKELKDSVHSSIIHKYVQG
jgi:hypothetical protein